MSINNPEKLKNLIHGWQDLSPDDRQALLEYYESVELLAQNGYNLEFNNKDQNHAAIVMSRIFKNAKDSIKIFCGSFSGEINNHPLYELALKDAIANQVKIEVIFEDNPNIESRGYRLLYQNKKNGKIHLSILNNDYKQKLEKNSVILGHFTIGDDRMFRYETNKKTFQAICNFDDKKTVSGLIGNFQILAMNTSPLN